MVMHMELHRTPSPRQKVRQDFALIWPAQWPCIFWKSLRQGVPLIHRPKVDQEESSVQQTVGKPQLSLTRRLENHQRNPSDFAFKRRDDVEAAASSV